MDCCVSTHIIEARLPTVSASATEAPPCSTPKGWWVCSFTGMVARTKSGPMFFMKPADAVVANGVAVAYPPRTANFHHEIELVVAIGRGGRDIREPRALEHVFGYAAGNDLTRRDLQDAAKQRGQPWDAAKS